jgi:hypothetical protein
MTEDQQRRKAEFDKLFDSLPGKNVEKIRRIADILCCRENSVRIYRLKKPTRVIPDSKLKILRRELEKPATA